MDNLTLVDILRPQTDVGTYADPYHLIDDELLEMSTKVQRVSDSEFILSTSISADIHYDIDDEMANHLRHDFVATATWGSTDVSLRELGIDSVLTPDCIIKEEGKVLELATSFTDSKEAMTNRFIEKRVAYESILRNTPAKYFILIVSPRSVMTNCSLPQSVVNKLCQRCRCGMSLVAQVEKLSGKVIQDQSGTKTSGNRAIKEILSSVQSWGRKESKDMNKDIMGLVNHILTPEDQEWVKMLVNKSLIQASEKCKKLRKSDHESRTQVAIENYTSSHESGTTRKSKKRVNIFPLTIVDDNPWSNRRILPALGINKTVPSSLIKLWESYNTSSSWLDQKNFTMLQDRATHEALMTVPIPKKHTLRTRSTIYPHLSDRDMDYIALSGPGAKLRSELKEVIEHEVESKKSFSLTSNVDDIEHFINSDLFTTHELDNSEEDVVLNGLCKSKLEMQHNADSVGVMQWFRKNTISQHASLISEVCTELAYEYKIPHRENQWGIKICRNLPIIILFRCTGTHVFFSLAMERKFSSHVDPGKLGPEVWETSNYYVSDFSSISESGLNHFIKALPYTMSLQADLYQLWKLPLPQKQVVEPNSYWQCLKTIYLIYLNNKLDCEETVTSIRYFYMNLFQESLRDLSIFTSRLPEVIRSRLTVYLLGKIFKLMRYYSKHGVKRIRLRDKEGKPVFKVHSVKNIYCDVEFDAQLLVNSFYFGYVVSKERGRIGERDVKVVSKILAEEFWYLDNITAPGIVLWDKREKPMKHCWDPYMMAHAIQHHLSQMNKVYGSGFEALLEQDLLEGMSKSSFIEIATLKASSREEEPNFYVPNPEQFKTHKLMKQELLRGNPSQTGTRPRVITKLFDTMAKFMTSTGNYSPGVVDVSVWCLKQLHNKGYFVADIFPKDQHGGDREIHVLHIYARMAQYLIEKISIIICGYFTHDSIAHPDYKDTYYSDHQKRAQQALGSHYTVCKSADATKWCQRNTSSLFYFMLAKYCPDYMEPYLYCFFFLWTNKRIQLPVPIVANFERNKTTKSNNDFYVEIRKRFYKGVAPFPNSKQRNCATIKSGMWQGILHRASTLKHSIFQNYWKSYAEKFFESNGVDAVVDVIQGSDDSAALISINDFRKNIFYLVEKVLEMKEILAEYISIWKSEAKSSVGTVNLIEYNSEWIFDNNIVKPTMRWALATLETSLVEKFVNRYQIYYGTLQQTLEAGGSTFLCSLLQMCQGYMHYILLGIKNSLLQEKAMELILKCHHPSLGYFPLDTDLNAGLTGLDFLLYRVQKLFNVPTHTYAQEDLSPQARIDYPDKVLKDVSRDINSTKIPFANYRIWNKLVEEMNIESLATLVKIIEESPQRLYLPSKSWQDQQLSCALKMYQPGVKESLSIHQPNIRMAAASAYVLTRPCVNAKALGDTERRSLFFMLSRSHQYYNDSKELLNSGVQFPNQGEYEEFNDYLIHVVDSFFYQTTDMKRTGKYELAVWGSQNVSDIPITDLCLRAWWGFKSIKVSGTMFKELWSQAKAKYGFLKDKESLTKESTGLNSLELCNFLKTISSRTRKLKLQDVPARGGGKEEVMTRVFWPQVKLRSDSNTSIQEMKYLRSSMFSVLTFPFKLSFKRSQIILLLKQSPLLSRRFIDLPRAAKRLKIFRDFIVTGNLINLITQIEQLKRGCIGFFTVRQSSSKGKEGITYAGPGEWRGKICGVSARIKFDSGIAVEIRFEKLTDLVELAKSTRSLITEFKSKVPEMPNRSRSNLYLTQKGYFESNTRVVSDSIPVVIDRSVHIDVFDAVSDYDWSFKVIENKMKLTCKASLEGGQEKEMTVLSDTFTSRDWDPTTEPLPIDEPLFNSWQLGQPAKVGDFLNCFGVEPVDRSILGVIARLKDQETRHRGNIDLKRAVFVFRRCLEKALIGHDKVALQEETQKAKVEGDLSQEDYGLFMQLCEWEDVEDELLEKFEQEASSDMSDETGSQIEDFENIREDIVDRLADLFFSVEQDEEGPTVSKYFGDSDMPDTLLFMRTVINWLESEDSEDIVKNCLMGAHSIEYISENLRLPSELRTILSVLFGVHIKDKYSTIREPDISKVSKSEASMSSFTEDYLITKSKDELVEAIQDMENFLPNARGVLKKKFESMVKKYKLELQAVNSLGEHNMLGYIPYWMFMDNLLSKLKQHKIWMKEPPDADLMTLRTLLLADGLDTISRESRYGIISDIAREEIFSVAWSELVTSGLCKLISMSMKLNLDIFLNEENVFSNHNVSYHKSLDLNFKIKEIESKYSDSNFGR